MRIENRNRQIRNLQSAIQLKGPFPLAKKTPPIVYSAEGGETKFKPWMAAGTGKNIPLLRRRKNTG
jgi:hypothetical protein